MIRRIGITVGEPCGIGPQLVVRALANPLPPNTEIRIYGSKNLLQATANVWKVAPPWEINANITLESTGPDLQIFQREQKDLRARAAIDALDRASDACLSGDLSALVTAPIDKSIVRTLHSDFTGHTEYLAGRASVARTVMCLDNGEIRVALVTNHVPLREVSKLLTSTELEQTLRVAREGMKRWFGIINPKIAIAGLNPHAGEIVEDAEETTVFAPVLAKLQNEKWDIHGPFPADSLFPNSRDGKWDLLISPYHDQGLVAAKYPGLDKVVNITLGLPYLRVSPGHGVAYDLKGPADIRSFTRALKIAMIGTHL